MPFALEALGVRSARSDTIILTDKAKRLFQQMQEPSLELVFCRLFPLPETVALTSGPVEFNDRLGADKPMWIAKNTTVLWNGFGSPTTVRILPVAVDHIDKSTDKQIKAAVVQLAVAEEDVRIRRRPYFGLLESVGSACSSTESAPE